MGLVSYDGKKKTIVFKCNRCEELGNDPMRIIPEDDVELVSGNGFAGSMLPLCPNCKTRSYLLPGDRVKGPLSHLRAVLFKRRYEAAGGDGNQELAQHKVFVDKLKKSYADDATDEAKDQFDGKKDFDKADNTGKPLKDKGKPVDE